MRKVFAVGYSTKPIDEFVRMLEAHGIDVLVDIRTIPKSRVRPDFNGNTLRKRLARHRIRYMHDKELGGLRKPMKDSINTAWRNESFRGFADYMQTREFAGAVRKLMALARGHTVAIMCAEGNPFRCHRSLIADALLTRGVRVYHTSGIKSERRHVLTSFAKVEGMRVIYPGARERAALRRARALMPSMRV